LKVIFKMWPQQWDKRQSSFQNNDKVSLVVARKTSSGGPPIRNLDEVDSSSSSSTSTPSSISEAAATENGSSISNGNGGLTRNGHSSSLTISHTRSKSAPAIHHKNKANGRRKPEDEDDDEDDSESEDEEDTESEDGSSADNRTDLSMAAANKRRVQPLVLLKKHKRNQQMQQQKMEKKKPTRDNGRAAGATDELHSSSAATITDEHLYDLPEGEDYLAIYETLDRVKRGSGRRRREGEFEGGVHGKELVKNKSHSMEALETPTPSLKSFEFPEPSSSQQKAEPQQPKKRHKSKTSNGVSNGHRRSVHEAKTPAPPPLPPLPPIPPSIVTSDFCNGIDTTDGFSLPSGSMAAFLKKALRMEGPQLQQRLITIKKIARESLGMRIGGGIGSNEGDTPIYIANIHPHGCIGKSKQMKVRRKRHP
jgi:hypothetical protein